MAASPALAVSPHFISATGTLNPNGSLTANFKEAGLGTNQNITYTLSANATATWACRPRFQHACSRQTGRASDFQDEGRLSRTGHDGPSTLLRAR